MCKSVLVARRDRYPGITESRHECQLSYSTNVEEEKGDHGDGHLDYAILILIFIHVLLKHV